MDKQDHSQPQVSGIVGGMPQLSYATNVYTGNPGQGSLVTSVVASQPTGQTTGVQIAEQRAYQQIHQQQQQELEQQLQSFWGNQRQEIDRLTEFKNHSLPLARIKKIMKADEDVRMISAEAPIVFARACEMFILELTLRAWNHTEENKRRTLQKNDIAAAIARTDVFDFLVDIIPREDLKDEALLAVPRNAMPLAESSGSLPYYYMQPQQMAPARPPAPGLPVNTPAIDPTLYGQQPHPYMAPHLWSEATAPQQPQSPSDS